MCGYVEQLERAHRDLEQECATDDLTGLGNRRAFQERLDTELTRGALNGAAVALVLLDVDFFKRYNDSYGHPAGDEVLRMLASLMRAACRAHDFAARVGGEEFALVLPGTTRESALVIAERLRRGVQRADIALYQSKRDGRNRVTMG